MKFGRRQLIGSGGLAFLGGGFLSRFDRVADAQSAPSLTETLRKQAGGASEKLLLGPQPGEEGPPEPATYDRLPLEWNRRTVQRDIGMMACRAGGLAVMAAGRSARCLCESSR